MLEVFAGLMKALFRDEEVFRVFALLKGGSLDVVMVAIVDVLAIFSPRPAR